MSSVNKQVFSNKFQQYIFPVHLREMRKFLPMCVMMFCALFNQNILRILKDSIVIPGISAEVTSFAKVYCVTPAAAIFVVIYAKMVNHFSFDRIYYFLLVFFVAFFVIFGFVLYPNLDIFQINPDVAAKMMAEHPHLKWYIAMAANWSLILFYVLAELWPNIFYILLFWQFANEVTETNEAQRFYTLFALIGNSSLIVVGIIMGNFASDDSILLRYFVGFDNKILLIQASTIIVVIFALIGALSVYYLSNFIITDPMYYRKAKFERSTKPKLGFVESLKYIVSSKYLWLLLICSASFGLTMNLVEAVWKAKMKELFPSVNAYAEFNSLVIFWTGVSIMVMTIIGNNIMRRFEWTVAAMIAPVVTLVTGVLFFIFVVYEGSLEQFSMQFYVAAPLVIAVMVGAVQNIIAKGVKYSIWDTSREMLYIPLDEELKTKGKAAVDLISSKVGKASSGLVQSILFVIIPAATYNSISFFLMIIFILTSFAWVYAVGVISKEYKKIS